MQDWLTVYHHHDLHEFWNYFHHQFYKAPQIGECKIVNSLLETKLIKQILVKWFSEDINNLKLTWENNEW